MTVSDSRPSARTLEFPILVGITVAASLLQLADWAITELALSSSTRFGESNLLNAYLFEVNPLAALLPKIAIIGLLATVTWIARRPQLRYLAWGIVGGALAAGSLTLFHNVDIVLRSWS